MLDEYKRPTPTGMKMQPMRKKNAITGLGVKIGCHALSRCCLNAESARRGRQSEVHLCRTLNALAPPGLFDSFFAGAGGRSAGAAAAPPAADAADDDDDEDAALLMKM